MDVANATAFVERMLPMTQLKMGDFAACTLFVYDYLLTLGMEVKYIWPGPWTPMKIIYFVQRYIPFLESLWLDLQIQFAQDPSVKMCAQANIARLCLMFVGFASSELILTVRVWAVWNKNPILTVLLPILFAAFWLPHIPILYFFLASFKFIAPSPPPLFGCITIAASDIIFVNWALLLAWNSLVLVLMLIPAFEAYILGGTSALSYIIYAQGIFYYICIFVMSALNIILLRLRSIDIGYRFMLVMTTRLLHSILASRVLLHIREAADTTLRQDIQPVQDPNAELPEPLLEVASIAPD